MLNVENLSFGHTAKLLFKDVNIKFTPGNCYGLIGANGAGKSTFLKILSGELEALSGSIVTNPNERIAMLRQDQFAFSEYPAVETVIMGHRKLYEIMKEKDRIYSQPEMTEADGLRVSELEGEFAAMNGWEAESEAAELLSHLGIAEDKHRLLMKDLTGAERVRVLLAQALFGNPDILLLDEPTNQMDPDSVLWLEDFLYDFKNTVIVVSHDRHFLDRVCTHICDIDYGKIQTFVGNYTFWVESSQLALRLRSEQNRRAEDKIKDLQTFIQRFASNASKSRQATSRRKLIDKLTLDDIRPSSRKFPHIIFKFERELGNDVLNIEGLSKTIEGVPILKDFSLHVRRGDKLAFVGPNELAATTLFQILAGEMQPDSGTFKWGVSTVRSYFPRDNTAFFKSNLNLVDWLRQFAAVTQQDDNYIRSFLGKMLFTGEESQKPVNVLSGGEKVRCMFSRMMVQGGNILVFDDPTNHLDLEAITALNTAMADFKGGILFTSHDHTLINTVANRLVEIGEHGMLDKLCSYDDYLSKEDIKAQRQAIHAWAQAGK